ncbi:MAG: ATP-binding cassette domain-containing protein [Gemmatimonadaceae bacterium]|nr:ATP-binding cassette domain-containing protein [Gemmatimonadaceae bacterium]
MSALDRATAPEAPRAVPLELRGISKRFGSAVALDDVSLAVRPGTVHALLGENGAGKTTLMRVAFGMVPPDAGEIRLDDRIVRFASARDAIAAGLGMVHQHFSLVPAMTVAENVVLGGRGRYSAPAAAAVVQRAAARAALAVDASARVADLDVGAQQRVEIVKALARDAALLILDEPTAVLAPTEAHELLQWMREFAARGGSVVLITHKLGDALEVADDITVLRRGRMIRSGPRSSFDHDSLVAALLGEGSPTARAVASGAPVGAPHADTAGAPVLTLDDAGWRDASGIVRLHPARCVVHAGEIVGVAAVEGSGQRELLRILSGRLAPTSGRAMLPDAVGFVPEDRHQDAMLLDGTLIETVALRGAGRARGRLPWRRIAEFTQSLMTRYDVRGRHASLPGRALSGGNQQKLVLARELEPAPAALVVENPTRGLDIRATAAVLDALRSARDHGLAVVMYSADLDEVLSVADRMFVLHAGHLRAVPLDRDAIGRAMLGAT